MTYFTYLILQRIICNDYLTQPLSGWPGRYDWFHCISKFCCISNLWDWDIHIYYVKNMSCKNTLTSIFCAVMVKFSVEWQWTTRQARADQIQCLTDAAEPQVLAKSFMQPAWQPAILLLPWNSSPPQTPQNQLMHWPCYSFNSDHSLVWLCTTSKLTHWGLNKMAAMLTWGWVGNKSLAEIVVTQFHEGKLCH